MLALLLFAAQAPSPPAIDEELCLVPVLRNGDFAEPRNPAIPGIPWWEVVGRGTAEVVAEGPDAFVLRLVGDVTVQQPVAAWDESVDRVQVRGRVRGHGSLTVNGRGVAMHEFGTGGKWEEFEFEVGLTRNVADEMRPRLLLQLSGESPDHTPQRVEWAALEAFAPLPCPTDAELRAEILAELRSFFDVCLASALDEAGERRTAFRACDFDAVTGAPLQPWMTSVGDVGLAEILFRAWRVEPDPAWEAALARFLDDYLALCIQPETGLPRRWDPVRDVPRADVPVEIRRAMRFLIDVSLEGPESHRAKARAAALDMGRAVLRFGVLPDGEVAAKYFPDGRTDMNYPPIRRLDVPSQLTRLSRLEDPELGAEFVRVAREACLTLEYDHYWPGTWHSIDPGFDDNYGHYGERAVAMWKAQPGDPVSRNLALSGYRRYAPLWRDALRYGGNVAADQVRCWRILGDVGRLEPGVMPEVRELVAAAVDSHFQGQQLDDGAWIDTTIRGFDPVQLPVGDTYGVPQTLLEGLGIAYAEDLVRTDEVRAMFTCVMRTTVERFRHEHGFRTSPHLVEGGANPGFEGSARFALGLVEMLERLP